MQIPTCLKCGITENLTCLKPKITENLKCLRSEIKLLKFLDIGYAGLTSWQFCSMHCSSSDCMVGGGATEIVGRPGGASCTVYIAEMLHKSSSQDYDAMEKPKPLFYSLSSVFKSEETNPILQGVKIILVTPQ